MAYDTSLAPVYRQKAASLLLTSQVPGSVSDAEVNAFFQELISDLESR